MILIKTEVKKQNIGQSDVIRMAHEQMRRRLGPLKDIIIVVVNVPAQGPMKREETQETMIKEITGGKAQEIETEIKIFIALGNVGI